MSFLCWPSRSNYYRSVALELTKIRFESQARRKQPDKYFIFLFLDTLIIKCIYMEQSYPAKLSAFTSINSDEQSPTTICGQGYVYTGPLSSQCYQLPSKCVEEVKPGTTNNATNNQYQFKVMLLGDSGVGTLKLFVEKFREFA